MQQTRKLPETFTGANDGVEIRIQELSVRFPDKSGSAVDALTHVNLEIRQGEFLSLVGPSGCGKTTLLRAIADLQQPTEGSITVRRGKYACKKSLALCSKSRCCTTGAPRGAMCACPWN